MKLALSALIVLGLSTAFAQGGTPATAPAAGHDTTATTAPETDGAAVTKGAKKEEKKATKKAKKGAEHTTEEKK